jgi:hypothetical protein
MSDKIKIPIYVNIDKIIKVPIKTSPNPLSDMEGRISVKNPSSHHINTKKKVNMSDEIKILLIRLLLVLDNI